jgi:hypothetical protein
MPKIVKTITNHSNTKAWILDSEYPQYFTQEEIDTVLTPFTTFMTGLTGNMGYTVEEVDNKLVIKQEFDTHENMVAAVQVTTGNNADAIVKTRNDLIKTKLTELGSNSSFAITFE